MEKSVGEKLKEYRQQRQWTQQDLAEKLNVTRQAVSNWERGKTLRDIYMVKAIAKVFEMTLDEYMQDARPANVQMPKTPGRLAAATIVVIVLYLAAGAITSSLSVEAVVGMVIIGVLCQGFLHLYFASSLKTDNFAMLAGYDSKVEYRTQEVKKVLIQMDFHVACVSFATVLLLGVCSFFEGSAWETVYLCITFFYCLDLSLALCFYNYRSIERTLVNEKDQKTAKAGYFSVGWFLGCVFLLIGTVMVKFELESIKNNSPKAQGMIGWMALFLVVTMAELFYEQHRAKKEVETSGTYRPGIAFVISSLLAAGILAALCFS